MLTSLEEQGSYMQYSKSLSEFEKAMALSDEEYKASTREKESGVTTTPEMAGEIPIRKLLKDKTFDAILRNA